MPLGLELGWFQKGDRGLHGQGLVRMQTVLFVVFKDAVKLGVITLVQQLRQRVHVHELCFQDARHQNGPSHAQRQRYRSWYGRARNVDLTVREEQNVGFQVRHEETLQSRQLDVVENVGFAEAVAGYYVRRLACTHCQ